MKKHTSLNRTHLTASIFALLLVIVFSLSLTMAAFSASARITGTITFLFDVSITATKTHFSGAGYTGVNGGTQLGYPLKQNLSAIDNASGENYVYGDKHGLYGKLYYEYAGNNLNETPDITYSITGSGIIYLAFELEFKFTPSAGQYATYSYLEELDGWPVYPNFATSFSQKQKVIVGSGENAVEEWSYYAPSFNANWGLVATAPFVSKTATTYSKTYRIFVVSPNEQGKSEVKRIVVSSTPFEIQLSSIVSEYRYMISEVMGDGRYVDAPILSEGEMAIAMKCKGSVTPFYDNFINP